MNSRHFGHPGRLSLCVALALSGSALLLSACQSTNRVAWQIQPTLKMVGAQTSNQSAEAYYRLGRYHDGQNRLALAENDYLKAIRANPAHVEARNALGVLLARQGRFDESIAILEEAASIAPKRAHVLSNLGHACQLSGQIEKAIAYLEKALELDAGNLKARKNLELALLHRETERVLAEEKPLAREQEIVGDAQAIHEVEIVEQSRKEENWPGRIETAEKGIIEPTRTESGMGQPDRLTSHEALVPKEYRLEIANGMGMDGAARRLRLLLRHEGEPRARVTDQRPFRSIQTRIEYAQGFEDEAARLAERLGGVAVPSGKLLETRAAHLRIVIGQDLKPLIASLPRLGTHNSGQV